MGCCLFNNAAITNKMELSTKNIFNYTPTTIKTAMMDEVNKFNSSKGTLIKIKDIQTEPYRIPIGAFVESEFHII